MSHKPVIGIALGSGSARGWAHVGILEALAEGGIHPDIVAGTSIGALVGAAHVTGRMPELAARVKEFNVGSVVGMLDLPASGGLIKGERLMEFLREVLPDVPIESLEGRYGAVATQLGSGREVWFTRGSLLDAVRASIAVPGLFSPVQRQGRWLVDGGLVNPVPVSVCRALGADLVVAVDLNSDRLAWRAPKGPALPRAEGNNGLWAKVTSRIREFTTRDGDDPPPVSEVLSASLHIMQVRITRSRLAGEPPDLTLAPRLAHLGLMDHHKAAQAIEEGRRCAGAMIPRFRELVEGG